jgi:hypothetical protein
MFQPIYYRISSAGPMHVALVVLCSYVSLGAYPTSDDEVLLVIIGKDNRELASTSSSSVNQPVSMDGRFQDVPENVISSNSSNRLCNMSGVFFDGVWIFTAIPVDEILLEDIKEQCWFVDREVSIVYDYPLGGFSKNVLAHNIVWYGVQVHLDTRSTSVKL